MSTLLSKKWVDVFSFAIPVAVALLLGIPYKLPLGAWTKSIPMLIGAVNTLTALVLIMSFIFIKQKKVDLHRRLQYVAVILGAVFLVLYVLYHVSNEATKYGGEGLIRYIYYTLLITHVVFSIGVVRLVLLGLYHALQGDFAAHKKVVAWAYPIWLYVSISGVLVYILISPYYS